MDASVWILTIALIVGLFVFDFAVVIRKPHDPSFRESVLWSLFYIAIALLFGASMYLWADTTSATEYFAGYVTEKSLSVDNMFVFLVIMTRFAVPSIYRSRVLLVGIAVALVLRAAFIVAGAAAISHFSWVFYLFGAFLVWTAIGIAREGVGDGAEPEYHESPIVRWMRRVYPVTDGYREGRLTVREGGKRMLTPLLIVMVAIGSTDILFALDSIPAIFGLTQDPFIVFAANAFALLGLRQLYFLVQGLIKRLIYLNYGLAIVLAFIGAKLVLEALHQNSLPFLNGGEPIEGLPHISINVSLTVILVTLAVSAGASLLASRARGTEDASGNAETASARVATQAPQDPQGPQDE